mmetsp:Transcript_58764/g.65752  ORF Transcript_58764/g.65752 Transcript_58764/m.65752 type:complete len:144 (-) Transcript_58764:191-622(-)
MIKINNATMKRSTRQVRLGVTAARTTTLKRSRSRPTVSPPSSSLSGTSSFDMKDLFEASQQINGEETTFPIPTAVESESWAFFDEIEHVLTRPPPRNNHKRHCRGLTLTRCHRSFNRNLTSLSDMAVILNTPSQRYGSNGSLS